MAFHALYILQRFALSLHCEIRFPEPHLLSTWEELLTLASSCWRCLRKISEAAKLTTNLVAGGLCWFVHLESAWIWYGGSVHPLLCLFAPDLNWLDIILQTLSIDFCLGKTRVSSIFFLPGWKTATVLVSHWCWGAKQMVCTLPTGHVYMFDVFVCFCFGIAKGLSEQRGQCLLLLGTWVTSSFVVRSRPFVGSPMGSALNCIILCLLPQALPTYFCGVSTMGSAL